MQKIIIADTSCLIVLDKVGYLDLLNKVFGEVVITQQVFEEFGKSAPPWILIEKTKNPNPNQKILEATLDKGEASSISLAMDYDDSLLIIDESKGRKIAKSLGLKITGTLGILVIAKSNNLIGEVKPIIDKIKSTNFRISPQLEQLVLIKCEEKI
ncbi:MAG: DUF3368 domain-containing protein [Cyclobacteriaceae bacterium]|nr:DUF3368 domain-containing protein [Cyclobacteriaceae bacterium]